MNVEILYDNPNESLLERILKIRNITDNHDDFLDPSFKTYRQDFGVFSAVQTAHHRIAQAIQNNENIMIFWDYDVDGIMSSYIMYSFLRKYIGYHNISIRLPHRVKDWYGIKTYHIDEIKACNCTLIITVDNWITSVKEINYAQQCGIDCIVTDHHMPLDTLPVCTALVNPQCFSWLRFKELCGATVALKVALSFAEFHGVSTDTKKMMFNEFLPFAAIATVADCMPLIDENRLLVKKWLERINNHREKLPQWLRHFLDHLNIKRMDTYHIWFMIWPRLNATWRMGDALDGLKSFLLNDEEKIIQQFEKMEQLNTDRKQLQESMMEIVKQQLNEEDKIIIAADSSFHEWIVGIIAWRITEKYNKPSLIVSIDHEKWTATGSLRWPSYFNIVAMLKSADQYLERYGGHEQAWWMTVSLKHIDTVFQHFKTYAQEVIPQDPPEKVLNVDTLLYEHELKASLLQSIAKLWPFGEWNNEPVVLIEEVIIIRTEVIGKTGQWHLKLFWKKWSTQFVIMQWWKWDSVDDIPIQEAISVIGKIKKDTYNWWFYIDGKKLLW